MVQSHYGRFLPQDKAALAARILNEVWKLPSKPVCRLLRFADHQIRRSIR